MTEISYDIYVNDNCATGSFTPDSLNAADLVEAFNSALQSQSATDMLRVGLMPFPTGTNSVSGPVTAKEMLLQWPGIADVDVECDGVIRTYLEVTCEELVQTLKLNNHPFVLDYNSRPEQLVRHIGEESPFRTATIYAAGYGPITTFTVYNFTADPSNVWVPWGAELTTVRDLPGYQLNLSMNEYDTSANDGAVASGGHWLSEPILPSDGPIDDPIIIDGPIMSSITSTKVMFTISDSTKSKIVYMPSYRDGGSPAPHRLYSSDIGQVCLNTYLDFSVSADFNSRETKAGALWPIHRPENWISPTSVGLLEMSLALTEQQFPYPIQLSIDTPATEHIKAAKGLKVVADLPLLLTLRISSNDATNVAWVRANQLLDVINTGGYYDTTYVANEDTNNGGWVTSQDAIFLSDDFSYTRNEIRTVLEPYSPVLVAIESLVPKYNPYVTIDVQTNDWQAWIDSAVLVPIDQYTAYSHTSTPTSIPYSGKLGYESQLYKVEITEPTRLTMASLVSVPNTGYIVFSVYKDKPGLAEGLYFDYDQDYPDRWQTDQHTLVGNEYNNSGYVRILDVYEPGTYYIRAINRQFNVPQYNGFISARTIQSINQAFATSYDESTGVVTYAPQDVNDKLATATRVEADPKLNVNGWYNYFTIRYLALGYRKLFPLPQSNTFELANCQGDLMVVFTETNEAPLLQSVRGNSYGGARTNTNDYVLAILSPSGAGYRFERVGNDIHFWTVPANTQNPAYIGQTITLGYIPYVWVFTSNEFRLVLAE